MAGKYGVTGSSVFVRTCRTKSVVVLAELYFPLRPDILKAIFNSMNTAATQVGRLVAVTLLRSGAKKPEGLQGTLRALGLKRINQTIYHRNNESIRGMIFKVSILIA